ncbi:MAG: hypothetical protein RR825_02410 [Ruthenibacterium sp.]
MQKHWRHFIKHMQRLMENVRRGSVVDIALLVSGVALVGALVTVFVVQLLPGSDAPDKNGPKESISSPSSAPAPSSSLAASSSSAASGGAVNPFPADGASSSSAAKPASSGKKPAASSSKKPAASSSKKPAASSSAAPPAPSSSAPPAPPTPPPAAHVHTYGAWVRECAVCETGTEIRHCTTCTAFEQRAVSATAAHQWEETIITDADKPNVQYQTKTCSVCHAVITTIITTSTPAASSSVPPAPSASSANP